MYEVVGFLLVLAVATIVVSKLASRLSPAMRRILWLGFWLRVAGCVARYIVLFHAYRGAGDAQSYFDRGLYLQSALWAFDIDGLETRGRLWGTSFVNIVSAAVLSVIGPTLLGEFLVFALASLIGIWLMITAVSHDISDLQHERYGLLLACAPSLCFWPCSVGKDALIILGLGFVVHGYVGRRGSPLWLQLVAGLALIAAIRPHIAAIAGLSLVAAEVMPGDGRGWSVARGIKLSLLSALAAQLTAQMGESFQFDPTEFAAVEEFVDQAAERTLEKGGRIESADGAARFLAAPVNVLFRPFPWEAHNVGAFIASFELVALWTYSWVWRRQLFRSMLTFHQHRTMRFAVPCGAMMAIAFGVTFFNLGILARQRVASLCLLLVIFAFRRTGGSDLELGHGSTRSLRAPQGSQ